MALLLIQARPANAQIQLITDPKIEAAQAWKQAQLQSLKLQLDTPELGDAMRTELEAQRDWLTDWTLNSLSEDPLWAEPESVAKLKTWIEPAVDPNRKASKVRERLFGKKAKPTRNDTDALTVLLKKFPKDLGVRQLHLHWIDQTQYRKQYTDEIIKAASRVVAILDQTKPTKALSEGTLDKVRAFAMYRKARGLAYQELPDVRAKAPIEDPKAHDAALLGATAELKRLVGNGQPAFVLIEVRMFRRDRWFGRGLKTLEDYGHRITPKWRLKKRRDILIDLGWTIPAEEAAAVFAKAFPEAAEEELAAKK